jgi:predicted phosphodiesterase
VQGVLNAGDVTDRGTLAEAELFARFADLGVPQVVVGGNHEDVPALERIARIPRTTVLQARAKDLAQIAGIAILGDSDPNATSISDDPFSPEVQRAMPMLCEALRDRFLAVRPQVVMVHDPRQGACAAAEAQRDGIPLVFVWGHLHKPAYSSANGVVSISPGTSGANGIKTGQPAPYGFALLEFNPQSRALTSACTFAFDAPGSVRETSCHLQPPSPGAAGSASNALIR